MPVAPEPEGNAVAAAPVAARGCLAVVCAGFVWLLNTWLFCVAVAALVLARAACGGAAECPGVIVLTAMSVAVTSLVLALVSFAAALLLGCFVLDPAGAREQMAAAIGEAMDGGRRAAMVGKVASLIFASIGILAFAVKVCPPLKRYERFSTVSLDAAALCTSALCCFVVIPTFGVRMWRRI